MRILIDIGHPAHVHYFKNLIKIMEKKGHQILVIARDKDVSLNLLKKFDIPFVNRHKGGTNFLSKLIYLPFADFLMLKNALKFRPDIFLSFASTYAAHVSKIWKKPHLAFDDTEHAKLEIFLYKSFSDALLNPSCFTTNLGKKQIKFSGYMELCSLHPKYFKPDKQIFSLLNLNESDNYAIIRFISWNASHDLGQTGMNYNTKIELIKLLSERMKVFISSENPLPEELIKFQISIPPERIHDALAFAAIFVGEGATMASEAAMMGTPSIYVNSLNAGTLIDQEKYGLLYGFRTSDGVINKIKEILDLSNLKEEFQFRRKQMLSEKIDVTAFMVWFVENYPESGMIMKKDPSYQYKFL